MPVTLPRPSRRSFLSGALAAGVGLMAGRRSEAAAVDQHRVALLSDTHISGKRGEVARGVNMAVHLEQVAREVVAADSRPAVALVAGDCAFNVGTAEDYAVLVDLLKPIRAADVPIHLALGNHDHRMNFFKGIAAADRMETPVEDRQVALVTMPRANWLVLDSLDVTNKTPGVLGEAQLAWLAKELDARADKPALVMVHHNPDTKAAPTGLTDTKALFELLLPRKQVKALFFGHTHDWNVTEKEGMHLINLPPVGYVFSPGKPNGWVDMQVAEAGAALELRCIDRLHKRHAEKVELKWRA